MKHFCVFYKVWGKRSSEFAVAANSPLAGHRVVTTRRLMSGLGGLCCAIQRENPSAASAAMTTDCQIVHAGFLFRTIWYVSHCQEPYKKVFIS